ncbi:MAG TPA: hypothetical protein PKC43_11430 [Phycisphaerales bacterium]|nr:hypothetical protein [Phycisphaerales bacterium]HMP38043.1 hypothetical protein [Phycisphaerales bacterium]
MAILALATSCAAPPAGDPPPQLARLAQVQGSQTVHATARLGSGAAVDTTQLLALLGLRTVEVAPEPAARDQRAAGGAYVFNVMLKDARLVLRDDGAVELERGIILIDSTYRAQGADGAPRAERDPMDPKGHAVPLEALATACGQLLSTSGVAMAPWPLGALHAPLWVAAAVPLPPLFVAAQQVAVAKPNPPLVVRPPIVAGSVGTRWVVQYLAGDRRSGPTVRVFLRSKEDDARIWVGPSDPADRSPIVWLDDPSQYLEVVGGSFASLRTLPVTPELERMLVALDREGRDLLVWTQPRR